MLKSEEDALPLIASAVAFITDNSNLCETHYHQTKVNQKIRNNLVRAASELSVTHDYIKNQLEENDNPAVPYYPRILEKLYHVLELLGSCVNVGASGDNEDAQEITLASNCVAEAIYLIQEEYQACLEDIEGCGQEEIYIEGGDDIEESNIERMCVILECAAQRFIRSSKIEKHEEIIFEQVSSVIHAFRLLSNVAEENSADAARYAITKCAFLFVAIDKTFKSFCETKNMNSAYANFDVMAAVLNVLAQTAQKYTDVSLASHTNKQISKSLLTHMGLLEGLALSIAVREDFESALRGIHISTFESSTGAGLCKIVSHMYKVQSNINGALVLFEKRGHKRNFDQKHEADFSIAEQASRNLYDAHMNIMKAVRGITIASENKDFDFIALENKKVDNLIRILLKTTICLERTLDRIDESRMLYDYNWNNDVAESLLPVFPGETPDDVICSSEFDYTWEAFVDGDYKNCKPNSWSYSIHKNFVSWMPWVAHNMKGDILCGGNKMFEQGEESPALKSDQWNSVGSELRDILIISHAMRDNSVRNAADYLQIFREVPVITR